MGNFNSGSTSLTELMKECGCGVGKISIAHGLKCEFTRIKRAEKAETMKAKRRRVDMARAVTVAQQEFLAAEKGRGGGGGGG